MILTLSVTALYMMISAIIPLAIKMLTPQSDEATGTDCVIGAHTPLLRWRCPDRKIWKYDPAKHKHIMLPLAAAAAALTAGSIVVIYKAGNEIIGSRVKIMEFGYDFLPTVANQQNENYQSVMRMPAFEIQGGQEIQVFVTDAVLVCTTADSVHMLEVDEAEQPGVAPK